jgi:hypothetical protein
MLTKKALLNAHFVEPRYIGRKLRICILLQELVGYIVMMKITAMHDV